MNSMDCAGRLSGLLKVIYPCNQSHGSNPTITQAAHAVKSPTPLQPASRVYSMLSFQSDRPVINSVPRIHGTRAGIGWLRSADVSARISNGSPRSVGLLDSGAVKRFVQSILQRIF